MLIVAMKTIYKGIMPKLKKRYFVLHGIKVGRRLLGGTMEALNFGIWASPRSSSLKLDSSPIFRWCKSSLSMIMFLEHCQENH